MLITCIVYLSRRSRVIPLVPYHIREVVDDKKRSQTTLWWMMYAAVVGRFHEGGSKHGLRSEGEGEHNGELEREGDGEVKVAGGPRRGLVLLDVV